MIPSPPTPTTVVMAISLALQMALGRQEPKQFKSRFETIGAKEIWDSLWVRLILLMANGVLVLGLDRLDLLPLLAAVALVDTLSYPVVSQFTLQAIGMANRFPLFILAITWIGNLRIILLMAALHLAGGGQSTAGTLVLTGVALWMLWATWSVASQTLGRRGWLGVGMLVLMMSVELVNALLVATFVHPLAFELPR